MCNASGVIFAASAVCPRDVAGRKVLEVGSLNVNGGVRDIFDRWEPEKYVGTDIESGPGVDIICDAGDLVNKFGTDSFDVVICTEVMEHIRNWQQVISNIKGVCRPGGIVVITTRSRDFPYHAFPYDFWRFEPEDMQQIFSDFQIERLEADWQAPGVFVSARKPSDFAECDLSDMALYSMIHNARVQKPEESAIQTRLKDAAVQEKAQTLWARFSRYGSWYLYRLLRLFSVTARA